MALTEAGDRPSLAMILREARDSPLAGWLAQAAGALEAGESLAEIATTTVTLAPHSPEGYLLWADYAAIAGRAAAAERALGRAIALDLASHRRSHPTPHPRDRQFWLRDRLARLYAEFPDALPLAAREPWDAPTASYLVGSPSEQDPAYGAIVAAHLRLLALAPEDWGLFRRLFGVAQARGYDLEAQWFCNFRLPDHWLAWFAVAVARATIATPPRQGSQIPAGSGSETSSGTIAIDLTERTGGGETIAHGQGWLDRDRHTRLVLDAQGTIVVRHCEGHLPYFLLHGLADAPPAKLVEGTVGYAVVRWSEDNYYHWTFDTLPLLGRLARGDRLGEPAAWEDFSALALNHRGHPFQWQALDLLGIPRAKILSATEAPRVGADRLRIPSPGGMTLESCEFLRGPLRDRARAVVGDRLREAPRRLYLSRARASSRRVRNEAEVLAALEPWGFRAIALEGFSLAEQIVLLSQAEVVVGLHGAGMANLVFLPPQAQIVEFFASTHVDLNFRDLARLLNLGYYQIIFRVEPQEQAELGLDCRVRLPVLLEAIALACQTHGPP